MGERRGGKTDWWTSTTIGGEGGEERAGGGRKGEKAMATTGGDIQREEGVNGVPIEGRSRGPQDIRACVQKADGGAEDGADDVVMV